MDPDQLASENPADLDLHCFQNLIYPNTIKQNTAFKAEERIHQNQWQFSCHRLVVM